jgi:hypothetical protein
MVGLNQAQIHPYEQGAAEPSMSALKRLALGPSVDLVRMTSLLEPQC